MKLFYPFLFILISSSGLFAQRTINVVGTSEIMVEPTIFRFSIMLREYQDGKNLKSIEELEKNLLKALGKADLPKDKLKVSSFNGGMYALRRKKDPEFRASKNYQLSLDDASKLDRVMENMDKMGVTNVYLIDATRDDLPDIRKENRVKALTAAKEKASYLLASMEEELGKPLKISEIPIAEFNNSPANTRGFSEMAAAADELMVESYEAPEFRQIKVVNRIYVLFEIKDQ